MTEKRRALLDLRAALHELWTVEDNAEIRCLLHAAYSAVNTILYVMAKATEAAK